MINDFKASVSKRNDLLQSRQKLNPEMLSHLTITRGIRASDGTLLPGLNSTNLPIVAKDEGTLIETYIKEYIELSRRYQSLYHTEMQASKNP